MSGGGLQAIGNYISVIGFVYSLFNPQKIYGPRLEDAAIQTVQAGVFIPFGYGTFPAKGHLIACSAPEEHEREEGGKGGPTTVTYYYTRTYAHGVCRRGGKIVRVYRNKKLVYDITPGSTILGKNAKFLENHTLYDGNQTTNDPDLEAAFGADNVHPYKGLTMMVAANVECPNGAAVDTYDFVVQNCGEVVNAQDLRAYFVAGLDSGGDVGTATRTASWTSHLNVIDPGLQLLHVAGRRNIAVGIDGDAPDQQFWLSNDRGETWALAADVSEPNREWRGVITGPDRFIAYGIGTGGDSGKSYLRWSYDGNLWFEIELATITGVDALAYGAGLYVLATNGTGGGVYTSATLEDWDNVSAVTSIQALHFNGDTWMGVGDNAKTYTAPASADVWTYRSEIGGGTFFFTCLEGGPGYFVAGASAGYGIFRTTDNGDTWTDVSAATGTATSVARGMGVLIMGFTSSGQFSDDNGVTWTNHTPVAGINDVAFLGPPGNWFVAPDAPGLYVDPETGVLHAEYVDNAYEGEACGEILENIVRDLAGQVGISLGDTSTEDDEIDAAELTDVVRGYVVSQETTPLACIQQLQKGFRFDPGEWDKQIHFPKRGGAPVASLTTDDLLARSEGSEPAFVQEEAQEVELLRKLTLLSIDPDAEFAVTPQPWERRAGVIAAVGESTVDLAIVFDADTAAQTAEILGKIDWAESQKFLDFGVCLKHAKLTPTDVITLTDYDGDEHSMRINSRHEQQNAITFPEAVRTRPSTYVSSAVGIGNPNIPPPVDTVAGPTLIAVMQIPEPLRTQDNTPGVYLGVAGMLPGWQGAQVLLSTDGGLSYSVVLSVTVPTIMGFLTSDEIATAGAEVRVYGGTLSSKTTPQVAAGANHFGVVTGGVTEVISAEDAIALTAEGYYDLDVIERGLAGTTEADHSAGDQFVDLNSAYFLPIDPEFSGQVLYIKAVAFGVSADAVDPVSFVYAAWEYVEDGGEIT